MICLLLLFQDSFKVEDPAEKRPLTVQKGFPKYDVVTASGTSGDDRLTITVAFADDILAGAKASKMGDSPFSLYVDTDANPQTGGEKGGEYWVRVHIGVKYTNGGEATTGGMSDFEVKDVFGTYDVEPFKKGESGWDVFMRYNADDKAQERRVKHCSISGKEITVKIPYAELGIKPGQVIRVWVREAQDADLNATLPEGKLTPK